ncbi:uncharacterized protein LOC122498800 [Leptopilina heterotoma]|uniref:uncharacterized protein LOC122498800 n=1 Tax=Leptopilina heterotoma TaxID=63436 RepID=UPI001CA7BB05|nr:uncharacterized protein LOC122498800 [Leptopilina heterotoma]
MENDLYFQNQTHLIEIESNLQNIHHRIKKRSLNFPKGSAFVMTMSVVKTLPIKGFTWNQVHEFDVIWPISNGSDKPNPKRKMQYQKMKKYRPPYWRNRIHRRELYSNFELALERFNLPGKICMLRTICEAKIFLQPPGVSLIEDMLRVILR